MKIKKPQAHVVIITIVIILLVIYAVARLVWPDRFKPKQEPITTTEYYFSADDYNFGYEDGYAAGRRAGYAEGYEDASAGRPYNKPN